MVWPRDRFGHGAWGEIGTTLGCDAHIDLEAFRGRDILAGVQIDLSDVNGVAQATGPTPWPPLLCGLELREVYRRPYSPSC
jgi:hypothetical protein